MLHAEHLQGVEVRTLRYFRWQVPVAFPVARKKRAGDAFVESNRNGIRGFSERRRWKKRAKNLHALNFIDAATADDGNANSLGLGWHEKRPPGRGINGMLLLLRGAPRQWLGAKTAALGGLGGLLSPVAGHDEGEGGAFPFFGADAKLAAVHHHDAAADGQPQSRAARRAAVGCVGLIENVKNLFLL